MGNKGRNFYSGIILIYIIKRSVRTTVTTALSGKEMKTLP